MSGRAGPPLCQYFCPGCFAPEAPTVDEEVDSVRDGARELPVVVDMFNESSAYREAASLDGTMAENDEG